MRALIALCALLAAAADTASASAPNQTVPATATNLLSEMDLVTTETDFVTTETDLVTTETDLVTTETDMVATPMASASTDKMAETETALVLTETDLMSTETEDATSVSPGGRGPGRADAEDECEAPTPPLLLLQTDQDRTISVEGGSLRISFANGAYLHVICTGDATLDGALPRVEPDTRVRNATLACAPPRCGYQRAMRRLGVQLVPGGRLTLLLPRAGPRLAAAHLARLHLAALELRRRARGEAPPAPHAGSLAARELSELGELVVRGVPLPPDALAAPPPSLTKLLVEDSASLVPRATLRALTTLSAQGAALEGDAPALLHLTLTLGAREPAPAWTRFPALRTLALSEWGEARPAPWAGRCALTSLWLTNARATQLPARWLAACPALEHLALYGARDLPELPGALLEGEGGAASPALVRLELRYGALASLPPTLFDPVPNLRYLDLTKNQLHVLPGGIFTTPLKLETLNLSKNKFANDSVYLQLGVLKNLRTLDLSLNRRLGDACPGDAAGRFDSGESRLHELRDLTELNLSFTRVTRICRDWREGMPRLLRLRLCSTNITRLSLNDLRYERDNATFALQPTVDLTGSNVSTVRYSAPDEDRAALLGPTRAAVLLSLPLRCDCELHRALRALRAHPSHAELGGTLLCAGGEALRAVSLDELLCEASIACPARCACASREEGAEAAPRWRVRVRCAGARLAALPALPRLDAPVSWDLQLAGNRISALDDLPRGLARLDLRNNSLRTVSALAAEALQEADAVLLAGNPLACDCEAAPLLRAAAALAAAAPRRIDAARCASGAPLPLPQRCAAERAGAGPGGSPAALLGALGAVLGALALTALGAGAVLARPAQRARLKGVLLAWGWLPRGADADADEEAGRRYDAFVSFAHEDAEWVRALAAQLEAGGLRLCLHERDWAPGEYIGAQIAASVRSARRTVAVVSRHFLRSRWARAEFLEALAAEAREGRPRLLVLLREEPRLLPLDRDLRRYLAANTYLRTDHPRFLPLLRKALPRPRPPPQPPAPALTPPTAA